MLTSARVATRNLWGRPGRTLLSLGAIAFGVAGIIVAGGFVQDVFIQLGEATIHSQLGHVQIGRNGYFSRGAGRPGDFLIDAPGPLVERLAGRDEVDDVLTRISFSGLLNNGRSDFSVLGEGVEPDKEARLGSYVMTTSGRALAAADRFGIALGHGVAEALRLKPGDAVTLVASTPDGAINTQEFNVVGTFRSYSREFDARAVRIQLAAAQSLLAGSGVTTIIVSLQDTSQTDPIAALAQQQKRNRPGR